MVFPSLSRSSSRFDFIKISDLPHLESLATNPSAEGPPSLSQACTPPCGPFSLSTPPSPSLVALRSAADFRSPDWAEGPFFVGFVVRTPPLFRVLVHISFSQLALREPFFVTFPPKVLTPLSFKRFIFSSPLGKPSFLSLISFPPTASLESPCASNPPFLSLARDAEP